MRPSRSWAAQLLLTAVRGYQIVLSPLKLGPTCRFEPTCSAYALEAIARHGAVRGSVLTMIRLAKCGPWHPGGYNPVPLRRHGRFGSDPTDPIDVDNR